MDDLQAYIGSGIWRTVLIDRTDSYGGPRELFAVAPDSFVTLVLALTHGGPATTCLIALSMLRVCRVRPVIAVAAAVVLAVEPVQLVHERLVLTEVFAVLLLAIYLVLELSYVERPRPATLVAIAAAGVLVLSFRLVYIPL